MKRPFLGAAIFTVVAILLFVYVGELLTRISGEATRGPGNGSLVSGVITPEAGEALFWGKGACYTCHAIGGRGSAIRGPNLGETGPLKMPIGARGVVRAQERAKQGKPMGAVAYQVEAL